MKIISEEDAHISALVSQLKAGNVIVCPTETCYGLSCDATNDQAVKKVFAIKQRQQSKSLLIVMSDIHMAMEYVIWGEQLQQLSERYWPGPLTLVAPKRHDVDLPDGIVAEDGTIAFRVSSHALPLALTAALQKPIVSTSANISTHASPYDVETIIQDFKGNTHQPDIIIDGGALPEQHPSTIVRVDPVHGIQVLRQGGIVVSTE